MCENCASGYQSVCGLLRVLIFIYFHRQAELLPPGFHGLKTSYVCIVIYSSKVVMGEEGDEMDFF